MSTQSTLFYLSMIQKTVALAVTVGTIVLNLIQPVAAQQMTDSDQHSPYILAVDEYVPAPGQFTNKMPEWTEGDDAAAMVQKCTERLAANEQSLVSLGAFGGFITFHFDHSIANISGQRDLYIMGNAFRQSGSSRNRGSSEPGIVMVMKDANHNHLPDDTWYELRGSCDEDSVGKVVYGYEVIYTSAPMQNIPWTDNQGGSGTIDRNPFNTQEYYPQWLPCPLTLRGTLLPKNGYKTSTSNASWVQDFMAWGYVDNFPNTDKQECSFDLDWAVDPLTRQPVHLDCIDFVRVYSAEQQKCGNLGETSTEIMGAEDLHLDASIAYIRSGIHATTQQKLSSCCYDLSGRQLPLESATRNVSPFLIIEGHKYRNR